MKLLKFNYYKDASYHFGKQILDVNDKPINYNKQLESVNGPIKLTMVTMYEEIRKYGGRSCPAVTVRSMVLMDSLNFLIKAKLNTGTNILFEGGGHPNPGSTITLKQYYVVRFHKDSDRVLLLVNDLSWYYPPYLPVCTSPVASTDGTAVIPDEYITQWYESELQHKVYKTALVVKACLHTGPKEIDFKSYLAEAPVEVTSVNDVTLHTTKKQKTCAVTDCLGKTCDCITKHGYLTCIVDMFPLSNMDWPDLYDQVVDRLDRNVRGASFEDFPPRHKRWALYWWYAINIFHIKGRASPLPDCFTDAVRKRFPNSNSEGYVGFRSTEDRLADVADLVYGQQAADGDV